jgi:hypothetical protein
MSRSRVQPAERGPEPSHPGAPLRPVPGRSAAGPGPVRALAARAAAHRAVRHPYLEHLRSGDLPDLVAAPRDFARHYRGYSFHFPRYLTAVMSSLVEPRHREPCSRPWSRSRVATTGRSSASCGPRGSTPPYLRASFWDFLLQRALQA